MTARQFIPLAALLALFGCKDDPGAEQPCSTYGCPCVTSATCGPGLECDLKTQTCTWSTGDSETDGEDPCPDGTLGCDCAEQGCFDDPMEGPLECVNGSCVDDDCPDGTLGCECTNMCLDGSTCIDGVCVDLTDPECLEPYEACNDNDLGPLGDCCGGTLCIGYESTNTWGCAPMCTTHGDCVTDCCVALEGVEDLHCNPSAANDCVKCIDTCQWAADGVCDDGGPGSEFDVCELGTDCTDCGSR